MLASKYRVLHSFLILMMMLFFLTLLIITDCCVGDSDNSCKFACDLECADSPRKDVVGRLTLENHHYQTISDMSSEQCSIEIPGQSLSSSERAALSS